MLATLDVRGQRVSINSFAERRKLKDLVSKEEYEEVLKARNQTEIVSDSSLADEDNGEKYDWVSIGDTKYGRIMYCLKTKIFRSQTLGEFYENSTVD